MGRQIETGGAAVIAARKKGISKTRLRDNLFCWAILLWPVIHFCIFMIGMNVSMVINSFSDYPSSAFIGFKNYKSVIMTFTGRAPTDYLSNPRALLNSLSILPLALLIDMPISLVFSFAIYKRYRGYRFFKVALFIPTVISAVVLCLVFSMAVSRDFGFIPRILQAVGLGSSIPAGGFLGDSSTAWWFILIFSIWTGISTNMIYFSSSMGGIPDSVLESAQIDGASDLKQFFAIVIPMIWGTITTMSITAVSTVFAWNLPALLLTGGKSGTSTIGLSIIVNAQARTNVGFISAFGVLIAVFGTAITYGTKKLLELAWRDK